LHDSAHQAREYPHVPGQVRVMRALVDGQHDQRDVGKNRGSVDSERNCGHIVAAGNSRQPVRLPGVKQVAEKNGKRHGRQNAASDQLLRETAQRRQTRDQQQVRKAAKEKPEKTIEIARDKPARSGGLPWLDRASDEGVLAS
jgi:hypothetical protein